MRNSNSHRKPTAEIMTVLKIYFVIVALCVVGLGIYAVLPKLQANSATQDKINVAVSRQAADSVQGNVVKDSYGNDTDVVDADAKDSGADTPEELEVTLSYVGDVLMHDTVLAAADAHLDDGADFSFLFKHMQELWSRCDWVIANMEGTLTPKLDDNDIFSGYPLFRAPRSLARFMHEAGIDMATTANNHCLDGGVGGFNSTLTALKANGIIPVGTRHGKNEQNFVMREIKGIKFAFAARTYETAKFPDGGIGINGIPLPAELYGRVDTFSYESPYLAEDIKSMQAQAEAMKAAGAQALIFFMHWGTEYNPQILFAARDIAQALADVGVHLILATGPHCIQAIESVAATDSDHQLLSYYSVGNFASAQQFTTGLGAPGSADIAGIAEDAIMAQVSFKLKKQASSSPLAADAGNGDNANKQTPATSAYISKATYLPLYCYKPHNADNRHYAQPIPLTKALQEPELVDNNLDLIIASARRTADIMHANSVADSFNFSDPFVDDPLLSCYAPA